MNVKPRRVKAKISRVVIEVVTAVLDRDGNIEEIEDAHYELISEDEKILDIIKILSVYS